MSNKDNTGNSILLEGKNLKKYFPVRRGIFARVNAWIKAVDDINIQIKKGETLGLVGESGCGKSTTSKLILLTEPLTSGSLWFEGKIQKIYSAEVQSII